MHLSLPSLSFALNAVSVLRGDQEQDPTSRFKHEAFELKEKRAVNAPLAELPAAIAAPQSTQLRTYAYFTPKPSATPIPITRQSQVETAFVPQMTVCALPPLQFFHGSYSYAGITPPYRNYSVSIPSGTGTCQTYYRTTPTTICATILTGLATRYTISECDQDLTFSSEYGYTLVNATASQSQSAPVTPATSVQTLMTYYIAPWQAFTTPGPLSDVDVEKKICNTFSNGSVQCLDIHEVWEVRTVNVTKTISSTIQIETTIRGPARVMIETLNMTITRAMTDISLSTVMHLQYELETESTRTRTRTRSPFSSPSRTRSEIDTTFTRTVYRVSSSTKRSSNEPTSTTTKRITSTVRSGTSTVTIGNSTTVIPVSTPDAEPLSVVDLVNFPRKLV